MSRLFISALALFASLLPAQEIHTLVSDGDYLAFPAVIELGDEVLVSFKRGKAHAALGSLRAGVINGVLMVYVKPVRSTGS